MVFRIIEKLICVDLLEFDIKRGEKIYLFKILLSDLVIG